MCNGIPLFSNGKVALFGTGTNSHSTAAKALKIDEDKYRKYEFHWWDRTIVPDYYDTEAERILSGIDKKKADKLVKELVAKNFRTLPQIANWLKKNKDDWGRLIDPKHKRLAKLVEPKLLIYQDKIKKFKKESIEKYNPYQAKKLPELSQLKKTIPGTVGDQVWDQVWAQVWDQVRAQVWAQVGDQVWAQVGDQVRAQVWAQVGDQVRAQVGAQVWAQVGDQVGATSYWGIKVVLGLPIKHWFFDFLRLGVMVIFVKGKVKVFGKKGKYLGEYDEKELFGD